MQTLEDVREFIAETIRRIYGDDEVRSPDALFVAERLGIERRQSLEASHVGETSDEPGNRWDLERSLSHVMSVRDPGPPPRWVIYHDLRMRPERQQFDVAHEIVEQHILDHPELLEGMDDGSGGLTPDGRLELAHRAACLCAKDFLINPDCLPRDLSALEGDLLALKKLYPHASHEALAYAMLPLMEPATILTILDQPDGQPRNAYRRLLPAPGSVHGNRPCPDPLTAPERAVSARCFETGEEVVEDEFLRMPHWPFEGMVNVRAFPVFEPGWRRVFLYLTAQTEL